MISGIIQVTGPHDVGKTTFALECGTKPERILFVDDDVKGRATVQQLKDVGIEFGQYVDFVQECKGKSLVDIHQAGMEIIDNIQPDQYDAIIWDTWSRFASTFKAYVTAYPTEFRKPREWSSMGTIKGAEQWKESQLYEAAVLNKMATLVKSVILVTHLKNHYGEGGVKSGKQIPDSSRTLNRVPRLRLWLTHNPSGSPVPCALVLKRLDVKRMTKRGLRTVTILPRKITPRPDDDSLWDTIDWYFDNPIGRRKATPDETPNAFELSILDGTLTKEQQETLKLSLRVKAQELEEEELAYQTAERQELIAQARSLQADGLKPGKIARELGISVKEVRELQE